MKAGRPLFVIALGLYATQAQTLLFRDFFSAFEGNELGIGLFFASWLTWVSAGASLGRHAARFAGWAPLIALLYPLAHVFQHYALLHVRGLAGVASYDVFPFARMLGYGFLINAPVSLVTGFLFTLCCGWWGEGAKKGFAPAKVYVFETLGATLGGAAVTLLLVAGQSAAAITMAATVVLLLGVAAAWRPRWPMVLVAGLLAAAMAGGVPEHWARAEAQASWARLLPRQAYAGRFATAQGTYLYGQRGPQFVVMDGASVVGTFPGDEPGAEKAAVTLAQCRDARRIAVLGVDALGACRQFCVLPQVEEVVWLAPDPGYPVQVAAALDQLGYPLPEKLCVSRAEALEHFGGHQKAYDLVVLDLPDATTLTLSRYVTTSFFETVKGSLSAAGVVALRITGGENALAGELAYVGASALATFEPVFGNTAMKPGEDTWLFGAPSGGLSESPAVLRDRFAAIAGADELFAATGLLSLYAPDRIAFQRQRYDEVVEAAGDGMLRNTRQAPRALLFSMLLALRQAGLRGWAAGVPVALAVGPWVALCIPLLYALLRWVYRTRPRAGSPGASLADAGFLVFSTGFAAMAMTVALMYLYQSYLGALYMHVGLVTALFMAGSFAGSFLISQWLGRSEAVPRKVLAGLLLIHAAFAGILALPPLHASLPFFAVLFFVAGLLTGAYFPVAAQWWRAARRSPAASGAALDTADHLGAAFGAAATGLVLLPLFGAVVTAAIVAAFLLANLPGLLPARTGPEADPAGRRIRPVGYALFGLAALVLLASNGTAWVLRGEEAERFEQHARALAGEAVLEAHTTSGPDGESLPFCSFADGDGYVFGSAAFVQGIHGYAGPIALALRIDADGRLEDFRIAASKETPAYLDLVRPWLGELKGAALFSPAPFEGVDGVSGATLTSRAIVDTLQGAGHAFARKALGRPIDAAAPQRMAAHTDSGAVWLARFLFLAVLLRFWPGLWRRRAFLLASVLVLGFWLNQQYASQHVLSLLSFETPPLGQGAAALLVVGVPVLTLLVGNVYCGYVCPFGALQELVGELRPATLQTGPGKRAWRYGRFAKYVVLAVLVIAFAVTRQSTVLDADPLITLFGAARTRNVLLLAVLLTALAWPYRRFWCRNLCPAGAFLALLGNLRLIRRLSPPTFPRHCDLGVGSRRELDCLRCDRCVHEKK